MFVKVKFKFNLLCGSYLLESQCFRNFHSQSREISRHINTQSSLNQPMKCRPYQSKYSSSLFVIFVCYHLGIDSNI